jgi:hypothetical protein
MRKAADAIATMTAGKSFVDFDSSGELRVKDTEKLVEAVV